MLLLKKNNNICQSPSAFFWLIQNNKKLKIKHHLREDCMEQFFKTLSEIQEFILRKYKKNILLKMSKKNKLKFKSVKTCYICKKNFVVNTDQNLTKVKDYDYISGKYRGATYSTLTTTWKILRYLFFSTTSGGITLTISLSIFLWFLNSL